MNKVILLGNLTRDPELKFLQTGKAICNFGIAVNRKWKTESGEQKEEVYFGECVAWGKTGEIIAQHFTKGKPILVEGRLSLESWDDKKTGEKKSKTRINVDSFHFAGGDRGEQRQSPPPATKASPAGAPDEDRDPPF